MNQSKKFPRTSMGRTSNTSSSFIQRPNSKVKVVECRKEEMLYFNFHFHFAPINISSKDLCILMSNNKMQQITQHIVDAKN